jgi:hypothetical protein
MLGNGSGRLGSFIGFGVIVGGRGVRVFDRDGRVIVPCGR